MIRDGRLEELDLAAIPNVKNLDPKFTKLSHDPEGRFSVASMAGSVGIVVNTDKIKEPIKGYADFFQEKYKRRLGVVNDNREFVSWALSMLGQPINGMSVLELHWGKHWLRGSHPGGPRSAAPRHTDKF